jgi:hypothetical protein
MSRPAGLPRPDDFAVAAAPAPEPAAGEVQVRNLWMSVDPYMRGRMYDRPSYVPPFELGKALQGHAVGEVVASTDPSLKAGDLVSHMYGWREGVTAPAAAFQKFDPQGLPAEAFLGVLGMPGLTAYGGFLEIGQPKPGETVFVSGAAGAVGSVVAQIAKIKGCSVVGSVGSEAKAQWLKEAGVDAAVNYKNGDLLSSVRAAAPKGLDIYFDNVGGEHLEVALELARPFARFVECGMISQYNADGAPIGPRNLIFVVGKQIRIEGFIVSRFQHLQAQFLEDMIGWIKAGKLRWEETVKHGIEEAAPAFLGLFTGANTGKMLVKLT